MKRTKVTLLLLLAALPVLLAPAKAVYAQDGTPVVWDQVICQAEYTTPETCDVALVDGDVSTYCVCGVIQLCLAEPAYIRSFQMQAAWGGGMKIWPQSGVQDLTYRGRSIPAFDHNVPAWYSVTNLGELDCVWVEFQNVGMFPPSIYEVTATSGSGTPDVWTGNMWMVQKKVGQALGAPIVSNFIYAILALIVGTWGLSMVIRGLFGATGVGHFQAGSGMTQGGSGLTHPREVGDVD